MVSLSATVIVFVVFIAFAAAISGVIMLGLFIQVRGKTTRELLRDSENCVVFLFENEELVDATDKAKQLLANQNTEQTAWRKLCSALSASYPDFANAAGQLQESNEIRLKPVTPDDESILIAEVWDGITRIEIINDAAVGSSMGMDSHSMLALNNELDTLRKTAEMAPYLVWQQTADGSITWANGAYLAVAKRLKNKPDNAIETWPPQRVFPTVSLSQGTPEERAHRVSVTFPDSSNEKWYEVFSTTVGEESLHFANSVDGVIRAETSLREFVQTLTKTFAHLPTGLAIFDKKRQLALFNPALTDLTGLSPMFLSLRPTLFSFLDKLREARVIPEPKDYKNWRQQMTDLEAAAVDGTYTENWALPSGQTYRVTGRPHPDGAVAFLFEDISTEVSLTRRFRSELEIGQAVLDSFDEAIAVFASNGQLTMSNSAYADFWGMDPGSILGEFCLSDAISFWQAKSEPSDVWSKLQSFTKAASPRAQWKDSILLNTGEKVPLRVTPLSGGGTLVAYSPKDKIKDSATPQFEHRPIKGEPLFTLNV
ncbi:PAS-domain containing protein [Halocynthiibacter sp. C4]|uniref:PAS-domain containing protein n=1 Tax=Halocynthiibacter sp. C4 TaxID=2992758 RepID=UPI00237C0EE2|nr:PAS-domain containing protein [Halocynthiibacter sp. C4]MDE0591025.1 PAS-domain containing protein [Halocynthiibacter sp. C4]